MSDNEQMSISARRHYMTPLRRGKIPPYLSSSSRLEALTMVLDKVEGGLSVETSMRVYDGNNPAPPGGYQGFIQLPLTFPIILMGEASVTAKDLTPRVLRGLLKMGEETLTPYMIGRFFVHPEHVISAEARDVSQPVGTERNPFTYTQTAQQKPFAALL